MRCQGEWRQGDEMLVENIDDVLIVEVARGVVRQVAPQEMPLFRANSDRYLKDPQQALRGAHGADNLLGFGAGVDVTLLTPIVLTVVSEVMKVLVTEVAKSAGHEAAPIIQEQVRRLFSRFRSAEPQPTDLPPLTHLQLAHIRTIAYDTACRLQISPDQASLLADSTVGNLVAG